MPRPTAPARTLAALAALLAGFGSGSAMALAAERDADSEATVTPAKKPKTRAAASVVPSSDSPEERELASGITEILIATLSAKGRYVLVGSLEFNEALGVGATGDVISCARDKICLGNAAARLGIRKLFAGIVGVREGAVTLNLNLIDAATFKTDRSSIVEAPNTDALFEKLSSAVDLLLRKARPANLIVKVNIPGATVLLDDVLELSGPTAMFPDLSPGEHKVSVRYEGYGEVVRTLTVSEGEDRELEVRLLPTGVSTRPIITRWWFLTTIGVAVAAGTTVLVLFLTADRIPTGVPVFQLE